MNIKKCKNCSCHFIDTLADGTKEHYCYAPSFGPRVIFDIPCKKRTKSMCKDIRKLKGKERKYYLYLQKKYEIDTSAEAVKQFSIEKIGVEPQSEKEFDSMRKIKISVESNDKNNDSDEIITKIFEECAEHVRRSINETQKGMV